MVSILNKLTKQVQDAPQAIDQELREHTHILHDHSHTEHDALHCPICGPMHKQLQALEIIAAGIQTLLRKTEEAQGTPHGDPGFVFTQASPAQNTVYTSPAIPYMGVVRSLVVGGPGDVTVKLVNPQGPVGSAQTIAILPLGGNSVPLNHHFIVPLGATFTLSTDSNLGTGLLALTAWIEPVAASGSEFFRIRR